MATGSSNVLEGKTVLITGGASGLGEALAHSVSHAGAKVILADRDEQLGAQLERTLHAEGGQAKYIAVDVSSTASVARLIRAALAWLPEGEAIDAAVLCAGVGDAGFDTAPADPAALESPAALEATDGLARIVQVNLVGALQCAQLLVKYGMGRAASPAGGVSVDRSITLVGSLAGYSALPSLSAYSASKWGVRGLYRSLRQALPEAGVRVNMVAPGFVKTPLLGPEVLAGLEAAGARFASTEDVVEAMMRTIMDEGCCGRALGVSSEGVVDLEDDAAGLNGLKVLGELSKKGAFGAQSSGG